MQGTNEFWGAHIFNYEIFIGRRLPNVILNFCFNYCFFTIVASLFSSLWIVYLHRWGSLISLFLILLWNFSIWPLLWLSFSLLASFYNYRSRLWPHFTTIVLAYGLILRLLFPLMASFYDYCFRLWPHFTTIVPTYGLILWLSSLFMALFYDYRSRLWPHFMTIVLAYGLILRPSSLFMASFYNYRHNYESHFTTICYYPVNGLVLYWIFSWFIGSFYMSQLPTGYFYFNLTRWVSRNLARDLEFSEKWNLILLICLLK